MKTEEILDLIVGALLDKKGRDIVSIKVEHLTIVAEHFLLASGTSAAQVRALAEYADEKLSKAGNPPKRTEGMREGRWVAMDFGSVVVHIFHADTRQQYMLEKLWDDGGNVTKYN